MHTIVIKGAEEGTTTVVVTDSEEMVALLRDQFGEMILLDHEYSDGRVDTN